MNYYSVNPLKTAILILALSTALVSINAVSAKSLNNYTYTASGTTTLQNAKLFKQFMANNPNIQIDTQFSKASKRNQNMNKSYTIKGKTTRSNVRKLIQLFRNSQQIELIANTRNETFTFSSDSSYYMQYQPPYFYNNIRTSMYKTPHNYAHTNAPFLIAAK